MNSSLTPSERHELGNIAGTMIPAAPDLGMPAANDPRILADIERSIGRDLADVRTALARPLRGDINDWYAQGGTAARSEERRVGKECRSRWSPYH